MYKLSRKSISKMRAVHPLLVAVMVRALSISKTDFGISEGLRTLPRQKRLVAEGSSKTLNSLHLMQEDGYVHAVDVYAWVNGSVSWDWRPYENIAFAVKAAAEELGVEITWGGDWKSFKDGPHFQIEV